MKSTQSPTENGSKFTISLKQQTKTGIAGFLISIVATIASIRALMYINFGVHSPANAVVYRWAVLLSLALPFVSILLGMAGIKHATKNNVLGAIGIGVSLFLLSTVGFAYLLSSLF
jgi:hypothetical protein